MKISDSPFGVPECETPDIYEKYANVLDDRVIVKIDALNCLKTTMDKGMFIDRGLLYSLVSGSVSRNLKYGDLLANYYKKFSSFGNYVDAVMMFDADGERNTLQSIIMPIRKNIDSYKLELKSLMSAKNGRLVLDTHDYLYFAFKTDEYSPIEDIEVERVFGCLKQV